MIDVNRDPVRWERSMTQDKDGQYVSYHDYAVLLNQHDRLRAELANAQRLYETAVDMCNVEHDAANKAEAELAALREQEPVAPVIFDSVPSRTTHIRKTGRKSFSGGEFAIYFECFKFEAGEWQYYYTDNDNEYPQWRCLNGGHYRYPDEIIKTLIPISAAAQEGK